MLREVAVAAIRTSKLSKEDGLGRGLVELDLDIAQQEVFGCLGPNGAGKTTTIRLLMGTTVGSAPPRIPPRYATTSLPR
jgi:ABC-type multidrug transport system ATPase subunit